LFRYGQADYSQSLLSSFANRKAAGEGVSVTLRGYIDAEIQVNDGKGQVTFRATELEIPGRVIEANEKTLLFVNSFPAYKIGDRLSVQGALRLPDNFTPDFDYIQYLKNKDIRTTMSYPKIFFENSVRLSAASKLKIPIYARLFDIKDIFQSAVRQALPETYAAYTNGILLGTRQEIPEELSAAFNRTGTTHVLAISGYNISIIAGALMYALVFFMRRRKAFWVSIIFISLFTILTGGTASVVRAAIMGVLLIFAKGYGRLYDPRNSILLAASIMVFISPLSIRHDVGFQLSFLAVLGLVYIYPILKKWFAKVPELKFVKETLLMSAAAQIMVVPLIAYQFHTFSLVSLLANVLILPAMSYTMLFGFLSGFGALLFASLGRAIGLLALPFEAYQLYAVKWLASWPWASVSVYMTTFLLLSAYLAISAVIWANNVSENQRS